MCDPITIATTVGAISSVAQGYSAYQQGKYQEGVAKFNARQLENEAIQTKNVGTEREMEHREKVQQLIGQQRAQIGASGVTFSGSAEQLLESSELQGEVDALRIRSNFERQAQSLEQQAELTEQQGRAARAAGRSALTGSLLSAAGTVAGGAVAGKWFGANSAASQAASGAVPLDLSKSLPNTFSSPGSLSLY